MDYIEIANQVNNSTLHDLALILGIVVPAIGSGLAAFFAFWSKVHAKAGADAAQVSAAAVTPNHGSSMADGVTRIEKRFNSLETKVDNIDEKVEHHLRTDAPCKCAGEATGTEVPRHGEFER